MPMKIDKRCYRFLLVLVTSLATPLATAATFEAEGEQVMTNMSREQAIKRARDQAMGEILAQSGINVSTQTILVNRRMASYQLLATRNARVVNFKCQDAELESSGRTATGQVIYVQRTRCSGEVQRFGDHAPTVDAQLALASRGRCADVAARGVRDADEPLFTVRAHEHFCLTLRTAAESWVGIYGLFEQEGDTRIVRIFPDVDDNAAAVHLAANQVPELPPLSGAPLPGEHEALEALIIVASRQPALLDNLAGKHGIGDDVAGTVDASVPISVFDRQLGKLDLRHINLKFLPYRIIAQ